MPALEAFSQKSMKKVRTVSMHINLHEQKQNEVELILLKLVEM